MIDDATVVTVYSEAFPVDDNTPVACQLVVIEGPGQGRAVSLGEDAVLVGADPSCDLVLGDERVSRQHMSARRVDASSFEVRDLGSRNGILYEGSLVEHARLGIGATVKIGRCFLRIQPEPRPFEVAPSQARRFGDLVAESLAMREVFAVLELAGASDVTVLVEGETGTGKELCARALHDVSARRNAPFVVVDCGALPETLLDSELFGHVRGAFTGAASDRLGAFARADGGTLFLDELGSISLDAQARLLRVLETGRFRPVGADVERSVDVRVVAASADGLDQLVTEGKFRPDLFYRLSVVRVRLPPLRERKEDLRGLVREMLRRRGLDLGEVIGANLNRLVAHSWPGNVRELRNVIDRAVAMSPGAQAFSDLRLMVAPRAGQEGLPARFDLPYTQAKQQLIERFERLYLTDLITRHDGNISAAARDAELDRKHLRTLLRRNGLID